MKKMSQELNLSRIYMNHCIRACAITVLDEEGFKAHHIVSISGHKDEQTITKSYSKQCPDMMKEQMSDTLTKRLAGKRTMDKQLALPAPLKKSKPALPSAENAENTPKGLPLKSQKCPSWSSSHQNQHASINLLVTLS